MALKWKTLATSLHSNALVTGSTYHIMYNKIILGLLTSENRTNKKLVAAGPRRPT